MSKILIFATITISLALVFYTIGVWSERRAGTLKKWHLGAFWLGLICDTTGTLTMAVIASSKAVNISMFSASLHGLTGVLAIVLMIFHAVWATIVLIKNDDATKQKFHKFSVTVWSIWLVPYFIGMIIGMTQ